MGTLINYKSLDFDMAIKRLKEAYDELNSIRYDSSSEISIPMKNVINNYGEAIKAVCNNILNVKGELNGLYTRLKYEDAKKVNSNGMDDLQEENRKKKRLEQIRQHGSGIAETERQKALDLQEKNRKSKQKKYSSGTGGTNSYTTPLATSIVTVTGIQKNATDTNAKVGDSSNFTNIFENGNINDVSKIERKGTDTTATTTNGNDNTGTTNNGNNTSTSNSNSNTKTVGQEEKSTIGTTPNKSNNDDTTSDKIKNQSKQTNEKNNKNSYTTVTRKEYASPNRQNITGNDNSNDQINSTKTDTNDKSNTIVNKSGEILKKKTDSTGKVITIGDDSTESTSTKKSNVVGNAFIGLGVVAAGAAAVAGARYAKKKHDDQEEYNDEDDQLDDNNQEYVDSAQYNNEEDYTSDDYLGPASNNSTINSSINSNYVDPEDLEEDSDYFNSSDDTVLEQLNLNN